MLEQVPLEERGGRVFTLQISKRYALRLGEDRVGRAVSDIGSKAGVYVDENLACAEASFG